MSRPGYRHLAIAAVSLLALAACDQTDTLVGDGAAARSAGPQSTTTVRMVERDVEAPEVFQVDEPGLWDGRPSLGGVWVAHPEVDDPERVIIRNDSTGDFVIGALFRRERENPGPRIQVSSDAASALGLLAGAPTVLNVTALRRIEEPDAAQPVQPGPVQSVERARPNPSGQAEQTVEARAEGARPQPASSPASGEPISQAELPRSRPAEAAAAGVPAEPQVALVGADTSPTRPARPRLSPEAIASATGGPARATATTPAPTPTPVRATPQPSGARIDRAYIQIGIFSVKDNATRTSQRMRGAGLQANMLEEQSQGQTFWRVTVGPAATTQERARVLANVKEMGFTDAYAVSR